jgi:hypothetical protein
MTSTTHQNRATTGQPHYQCSPTSDHKTRIAPYQCALSQDPRLIRLLRHVPRLIIHRAHKPMLANLVPCPNGPVTSRLSPVKRDANSPVKRDASSPVKRDASSPVKRDAGNPRR